MRLAEDDLVEVGDQSTVNCNIPLAADETVEVEDEGFVKLSRVHSSGQIGSSRAAKCVGT